MNKEPIDPRLALWLRPISDTHPAGESCRYEPEYEEIEIEMNKLDAIEPADPDWARIESQGSVLLQQKSKALAVVAPLTVALLKEKGVVGLETGLALLKAVVSSFPEVERRRAQAGAYAWMTQQLLSDLTKRQVEAFDQGPLETCIAHFNAADEALRTRFESNHPPVGRLKKALQDLLARAAPPEEAPVEVEPVKETATPKVIDDVPAAAPATVGAPVVAEPQGFLLPETIENEDQANAIVEWLREGLNKLALYHLEADDSQAVGYHLAHVASFLCVTPDGARSQKLIAPGTIQAMETAIEGGRARHALELLRSQVGEVDLSLSALHATARALKLAGEKYEDAEKTVSGHAVGFFHRMAERVDTTPKTQAWLAELGQKGDEYETPLTTHTAQTGANASADADWLAESVESISSMAREGGIEAACRWAHERMKTVGEKRPRFQLRLALASACIEHEAYALARSLLLDLKRELQESIGSWEPVLSVTVLRRLLACNRQLIEASMDADALRSECEDLLQMLALFDAAAAHVERVNHS